MCVCVCVKVSIERVIYYNLFCMYLYILHPTHRIKYRQNLNLETYDKLSLFQKL